MRMKTLLSLLELAGGDLHQALDGCGIAVKPDLIDHSGHDQQMRFAENSEKRLRHLQTKGRDRLARQFRYRQIL